MCDVTDIIKNATEELKIFKKKWLPELFPASLQSLAEVYSCTRGLRGGADKSLARPTSRCRRTESMCRWKEGYDHVPNCKSFLVTEAERKHVRRRARFQ